MFEESNNYNQSSSWNNVPMFREPPMTPLPGYYMNDDTRQNPMPQPHAEGQDMDIIPPVSPIINNPLYNQGWLKTQIGKYMTINFLLGTDTYQDRSGILQEVGISFIVIKDATTNDLTMCDIYSIKFVTIYNNQAKCNRNINE